MTIFEQVAKRRKFGAEYDIVWGRNIRRPRLYVVYGLWRSNPILAWEPVNDQWFAAHDRRYVPEGDAITLEYKLLKMLVTKGYAAMIALRLEGV